MQTKTLYPVKFAWQKTLINSGRGRSFLVPQMRLVRQLLQRFTSNLKLWQQRHRQRSELYSLSDAILKDIGISRVDALREADKPFWQS
jgi:uncharacterized protein YjiS (DUF1127 family)